MPSRIALVIGNGRFPKAPQLAALAGPANDVRYLGAVLADEQFGRFEVRQFLDRPHYELLEAIEETLDAARPDDFMLIYYSGHGKLLGNQLCLATASTRLEALYATSIPLPSLRVLIERSRVNQTVLLLDCCFSGAAGKAWATRGSADDVLGQEPASGLHILTSATSIQVSTEREREAGGEVLGDFTRCVVDGIRSGAADVDQGGEITVQELRTYVDRNLRGQRPRYWGIEASGDPIVAWNRAGGEQLRRDEEERPRTELAKGELGQAVQSPRLGVRDESTHQSDWQLYAGENLRQNWWLWRIRGVLGMALGLFLFSDSSNWIPSYQFYAFVDGVLAVISAVRLRNPMNRLNAHLIASPVGLAGLAGVMAGMAIAVLPVSPLLILVSWAVVKGVLEIAAALRFDTNLSMTADGFGYSLRRFRSEWWLVLSGIASIGFGALLFEEPAHLRFAAINGISYRSTHLIAYPLLFGALLFALSIKLRRSDPVSNGQAVAI